MSKKKYPAATMAPAEVPENVNEAYELVRPLLYHQVSKFKRCYPTTDHDELVGQAEVAFVRGHWEFKSGKTNGGRTIKDPYATSIRRWIWFSMFDAMRARITKADATEAIGERDFIANDPPPRFDVADLGLEEDGVYVAELLLDPPRSLAIPAEKRGGSPRNYRSTLREWLSDRGWAASRISAAFAQIKNSLANAAD